MAVANISHFIKQLYEHQMATVVLFEDNFASFRIAIQEFLYYHVSGVSKVITIREREREKQCMTN